MITIFNGVDEYEVLESDILTLGEVHEGSLELNFPEIEDINVGWDVVTREGRMRCLELKRNSNGPCYIYLYLPAQAAEQLAVTITQYMSMAKLTGVAYKLDISALYGYDVPPTDEELEEWKAAVRKEYEARCESFENYMVEELGRLVKLGEQVAKL